MEALKTLFKKAGNRIRGQRMVHAGSSGLLAGLLVSVLLLLLGRWIPIAHVRLWAGALTGLGLIAGTAAGGFRSLSLMETARRLDAAEPGTERSDLFVTALEYANEVSPAAQWQRLQAEQAAGHVQTRLASRLPARKYPRLWSAGLAVLCLLLILMAVPNPMDEQLAAREKERSWVQEQSAQVEELVRKTEGLDSETKRQAAARLRELEKVLSKTKDAKLALDQIEKAQQELEKLAKQMEDSRQALKRLADQMLSQPELKQLAQAIQTGDAKQIRQAGETLKRKLSQMKPQDQAKLQEQLKQLAAQSQQQRGQTALSEALNQTAEAMKQKDAAQREQAVEELAGKLAAAADRQAAEAAANASAQLGQQGRQLADQMAAAGMTVPDAWGRSSNADMAAAGADGNPASYSDSSGSDGDPTNAGGAGAEGSQGAGQQAGSGSGSNPGQGSGSGSGRSGQGAGSGTGGSGSGQGSGSGNGGGAGLGTGGRTLVTTPRGLKGSGSASNDAGPVRSGGSVQRGGKAAVEAGQSRSYTEVYGSYAAAAKDSLNRSDLPAQMQGLVENYFMEINPDP
ncbi:phage tail tape measure protein [Paenibacillus sp. JX-17]|uniref:Phage tail tape measure protein n=1 Tax=Paenibacillus lacisoli TaxID=3064525 RepID=A0ABT9CDF9_9BACL|nr:phage tail tape measure protein [Paenibacillus sp. JX-17]MDO7907309.1 phage tail tape measure protein [Paenibacillus sp. JX-17]